MGKKNSLLKCLYDLLQKCFKKETCKIEINMQDEEIIAKALRSINDKDSKSFKIKEYYSDLMEGNLDEGGIALAKSKIINIEKELMNWNKKQAKKPRFTTKERGIMSPEESALVLIKHLRERGLLNDINSTR